MSVTELRSRSDVERCAREELAACFRWTAQLNMHEAVANHFSYSLSEDGAEFLLNPCGRHFSRIRAGDLLCVDARDPATRERDDIDPTAWCIHGAIHRAVPSARCLMHVHSKYATALACLADPSMPPIDQNTARFFERIAVDSDFNGMGLDDEAERLASVLDGKPIVLMGNHGFMAVGESIALTFDHLYYFERACETLITALSSGRQLKVLADAVARKTAQQWIDYSWAADRHLGEVMAILDQQSADYRD